MDKWGAVNTKLTKEGDVPRSTVVVCILAGVLIAGGLFVAGMYAAEPVIDEYLNETKGIIHLYDFYDLNIGEDQTAVYFIGSSIIGASIYPPYINQNLSNNDYNITTYNLYISSDTPRRRSIELQNIIASAPSLIIYGVTYRSVTDRAEWPDEQIVLVHSRLKILNDSLQLYSQKERNDLKIKPTIYYKKKFIPNAVSYTPVVHDPTFDYLNDPNGLISRRYYDTTKKPEQILKEANNPKDPWRPIVTNESTRYKQALIYNVQTLQNAGIPVVLINMPLHPLTSEKITDESRQNFYDLLNETGAKWYDMEFGCGDECFIDSHHMTFYGATQFAPRMAELIISEVKSGAVHYA
ncbi:hypothetical protein O0S10_02300 [Methanocorpusculum sp. MG]|uniref:Uncharacterized protein n=1 Tax=Methanocorpusculum petauri TaxID=3002863 RepID=A0ABT4IE97_9EURY|nr:hypothetical protein [Methanocorpusculum petauri]MCZ0860060.1 hypothetical protein [Methanocorpusculum petauri]